MRDKFVFPETGEKMANSILTRFTGGEYNSYDKMKVFCEALTADLRTICQDKHLLCFTVRKKPFVISKTTDLEYKEELQIILTNLSK